MKRPNELAERVNLKTGKLLLLAMATAGVYLFVYMFDVMREFKSVTGKTISSKATVIWFAACSSWSGAFTGSGIEGFDIVAGILVIVAAGFYFAWVFAARSALQSFAACEHQITLKMNVFYTIFFGQYYINYCINDLDTQCVMQNNVKA